MVNTTNIEILKTKSLTVILKTKSFRGYVTKTLQNYGKSEDIENPTK